MPRWKSSTSMPASINSINAGNWYRVPDNPPAARPRIRNSRHCHLMPESKAGVVMHFAARAFRCVLQRGFERTRRRRLRTVHWSYSASPVQCGCYSERGNGRLRLPAASWRCQGIVRVFQAYRSRQRCAVRCCTCQHGNGVETLRQCGMAAARRFVCAIVRLNESVRPVWDQVRTRSSQQWRLR